MDALKPQHFAAPHVKFGQGCGKGHGFGQAMFGHTAGAGGFQRRVQDVSARRARSRVAQALACPFGQEAVIVLGALGDQSSPSYRLIGAPGMMVEIACL